MKWVLQELGGGEQGTEHVLEEPGPVLIGRASDCAIRIESREVSRRHCLLRYRRGRWHVEDLGSRNGTKVNGEKKRRSELSDGDMLSLGGVRLCLQLGRPLARGAAGTADSYEQEQSGEGRAPSGDLTQEIPVATDPSAAGVGPAELLGRRYELGELIHQGSTGTFYRAKDVESSRAVCVKVLSGAVAGDEDELARFVRGVRTAAKLRHRNIVRLYRAGRSRRGQWWLAMEYVDGMSLRQLVAQYGVGHMLSPGRVVGVARDIVGAFEVAYERQVLHRNIKPDNILLTKVGVAKLGDFSLARGVVLTTLQRITSTDEVVGDLAFMAPERAEPGGVVDCRSDIYALGACLYTLLAGRPPFTGRGMVDLIERIRNERPVPPSRFNLSVPGPLEGIVLKCLAKSPTERFESPMELREELARVAKFQGLGR